MMRVAGVAALLVGAIVVTASEHRCSLSLSRRSHANASRRRTEKSLKKVSLDGTIPAVLPSSKGSFKLLGNVTFAHLLDERSR
jgi:hypothetical protein